MKHKLLFASMDPQNVLNRFTLGYAKLTPVLIQRQVTGRAALTTLPGFDACENYVSLR